VPTLTLADLVANGTMSPEIAATLRATAQGRHSFLVVAIPRLAGKSTVMAAILAHAPTGAPVATIGEDGLDIDALAVASSGGYVVIPEISEYPVTPGYIWGAPVRRVFAHVGKEVALAAALHAPGAEEAMEVVCRGNGVADAQAAEIAVVVYIRSLGRDWRRPTARRIATVHEVVGVKSGQAETRLLHRWDEQADRFDTVAQPRRIALTRPSR
jgi:Flp pilus assembly CpaF family ATPase